MRCEHPACNGRHKHEGPLRDLCPAAQERALASARLRAARRIDDRVRDRSEYLARPEVRERRRRLQPEYQARSNARRLMRGERIAHAGEHHRGMAKWKEWLGDPRPAGLELSLLRDDSPAVYLGRNGYRLSMDPADYGWETHAENMARQKRRTR